MLSRAECIPGNLWAKVWSTSLPWPLLNCYLQPVTGAVLLAAAAPEPVSLVTAAISAMMPAVF